MISRSIGVKPIDNVGATPLDMKNTMRAFVAHATIDEPRLGVLYPHEVPLVSGEADLNYVVGRCHVVVSSGKEYGVHILTVTDTTPVPTVAGSDTGTRIDLVTIRQQDPDVGDDSNEPILEVIQGETAVSNPQPPTDKIPQGALILAEVTVPAGMTATNLPGVRIDVNVPYTALRGTPIPVRGQWELDDLQGADLGTQVLRLDRGGSVQTVTENGAIGPDGVALLAKPMDWDVIGVVRRRVVRSNVSDPWLEMEVCGRYQRTGGALTIGSKWTKILPETIPDGFRPKKQENGDIMRATDMTFPYWPVGDTDELPSLQLEATDAGNIWARAMSGSVTIRQWALMNVNMKYLRD